jgi:hypothetical protein
MISNTGQDFNFWWWYPDESSDVIGNEISSHEARLLDVTPAGGGNFNAVMEYCAEGCPATWWYYGVDWYGALSKAQNHGARVMTAEPYGDCGGGKVCLVITLIDNSPPDITACDPEGCISEAKLRDNICGELEGNVVGYSCEVGGVRPSYGGLARTAINPPSLAMAPDLVTNIASVSKTMTAIAILQLLAFDGMTINDKISPYIYSDWHQGKNVDQITFKDLLTHTSGFGQQTLFNCKADIKYSGVQAVVANGVDDATDVGKPNMEIVTSHSCES